MDNQTYTENLNRAPEKEPERQQYFMELLRNLAEERSRELGRPLTACIQTFGCQMNAKDSEKLMGILKEAGFTESESEASDFVLYNTCTVRDNANQRVYGRLGYLNSLKQKNPDMVIALCGCMMQEPTVVEKIKKSYRFVDLIFGTHNIYKLAELLYRKYAKKGMVIDVWEGPEAIVEDPICLAAYVLPPYVASEEFQPSPTHSVFAGCFRDPDLTGVFFSASGSFSVPE